MANGETATSLVPDGITGHAPTQSHATSTDTTVDDRLKGLRTGGPIVADQQTHAGMSPHMPTSDSEPMRAEERKKRADKIPMTDPPHTPAAPDQGLPRNKRRK